MLSITTPNVIVDGHDLASLWRYMRREARRSAQQEPILASYYHSAILNHETFEDGLSYHLANKLENDTVPAMLVREIIQQALKEDPKICQSIATDIRAIKLRDPACKDYSTPFLYYKGFHALQSYRIAHWLWNQNRTSLAFFFQNQISMVFAVDIHPAAQIGDGILVDHATGIVIGETAIIEDEVSILQSVTLGGTGKERGDRHPKVRKGVLLSAGAKVLGNIEVGEGAKVGAGSVVLHDVPPHVTVAGVPARIVGRPSDEQPALSMDQSLEP